MIALAPRTTASAERRRRRRVAWGSRPRL